MMERVEQLPGAEIGRARQLCRTGGASTIYVPVEALQPVPTEVCLPQLQHHVRWHAFPQALSRSVFSRWPRHARGDAGTPKRNRAVTQER